MRDIRIYLYEAGQLKKVNLFGRNTISFHSEQEALDYMKKRGWFKKWYKSNGQVVLAEYFDKYDSKIIKLVTKEEVTK